MDLICLQIRLFKLCKSFISDVQNGFWWTLSDHDTTQYTDEWMWCFRKKDRHGLGFSVLKSKHFYASFQKLVKVALK